MPTSTPEKKRTRNTSELPIGVAAQMLANIETWRTDERDMATRTAIEKVQKRYLEKRDALLARVPEQAQAIVVQMADELRNAEPHPRGFDITTEEHAPTPNASLMAEPPKIDAVSRVDGKATKVQL